VTGLDAAFGGSATGTWRGTSTRGEGVTEGAGEGATAAGTEEAVPEVPRPERFAATRRAEGFRDVVFGVDFFVPREADTGFAGGTGAVDTAAGADFLAGCCLPGFAGIATATGLTVTAERLGFTEGGATGADLEDAVDALVD
jgi:hypothetical protein